MESTEIPSRLRSDLIGSGRYYKAYGRKEEIPHPLPPPPKKKKNSMPQRPRLRTQIAATPSAKRNTQIESGKMAIHARVVGNPFDCGYGAITLIGNQIIGQRQWSSDSHSSPPALSPPPPPLRSAPLPPPLLLHFPVAILTWY